MSRRRLLLVGLLVTLLVAGVGSYYASAHPDGLEYVAERTGFLDSAEESATAGSPLADYETRGVENEWLSGALTGVIGVLVVLLVMGALAYGLRRREDPAENGD